MEELLYESKPYALGGIGIAAMILAPNSLCEFWGSILLFMSMIILYLRWEHRRGI